MIRVADYFASKLAEHGTEAAFMLSGGMMMHLMDAVGRVPSIRYYCNHHEQASAMAADSYSRISGRSGLCFATSGPGATNLLTGLVGAYQDSSPVVFLTGQVKRGDTIRASGIVGLRQYGFLEVDIVPIVQSVTKYAVFVDDPMQARYHIEKALHLCTSGRPGPVLLDVPLDVQGAMIDPNTLQGYVHLPEPTDDLSSAAHSILSELLLAERPLVLAGQGVRRSGAVELFRMLADRLGIPVVTTQIAKDLLPHDHTMFVGHPGVRGDRAGNFAVQTADVILAIGTSLHNQTIGWESELFAPSAHKIHVDPDFAVLQKTRSLVDRQVIGHVGAFLENLSVALKLRSSMDNPTAQHTGWRHQCKTWKTTYTSTNEPHNLGPMDGPVNLYEIMDILSELLSGDEVILTDAGQPTYVCAQGLRLKAGQRYLVPGALAEMGWAVPAAIGAAVAAPGRRIIVISGDGSLQTNVQELQTLKHYGFDIKVFVINNDGYASIRATQSRFFDGFYVGSTRQSGVSIPPWDKVAAAFGLTHLICPNREMLRGILAQALTMPGPLLCEIVASQDQQIMPGVPSVRQADGTMRSAPLHQMAPSIPDDELPVIPQRRSTGRLQQRPDA